MTPTHAQTPTQAAPKLLLIMLDAGSAALLKRWAADGTLPVIGGLMRASRVADTRSPAAFYIGATWVSFYTAADPARHGIYWLDRLDPGGYRTTLVGADELSRLPSLWQAASDQGRRLILLDVPLTAEIPGLNGVQVIEWRSHDAIFGFRTVPRELGDTIIRSVGHHPGPEVCDRTRRSVAEYGKLGDQLAKGALLRGQLTGQLLAEHPWDFATVVFNESHCAGHQLWHFHDPEHPAFDAVVTAASGDLIRKVYGAIDQAVGEILAGVDADTTVAFTTLHSMSYTVGTANLLPEVLVRLGFMVRPSFDAQPPPATWRERAIRIARRLYHVVPSAIRLPLYQLRHQVARRIGDGATPIMVDPARSRCFAVPSGAQYGAIRLNLRGRESAGILEPGPDAEECCRELTAELMKMVDVDSGRPIVRRVVRTADVCRGDKLDTLPDLIVEWDLDRVSGASTVGNGAGAMLRVSSDRLGEIEVANDYARSGDHRPEGVFAVRGPGITPGAFADTVDLVDLAPTLARFLGCRMDPADGQPVPGLLDPPASDPAVRTAAGAARAPRAASAAGGSGSDTAP